MIRGAAGTRGRGRRRPAPRRACRAGGVPVPRSRKSRSSVTRLGTWRSGGDTRYVAAPSTAYAGSTRSSVPALQLAQQPGRSGTRRCPHRPASACRTAPRSSAVIGPATDTCSMPARPAQPPGVQLAGRPVHDAVVGGQIGQPPRPPLRSRYAGRGVQPQLRRWPPCGPPSWNRPARPMRSARSTPSSTRFTRRLVTTRSSWIRGYWRTKSASTDGCPRPPGSGGMAQAHQPARLLGQLGDVAGRLGQALQRPAHLGQVALTRLGQPQLAGGALQQAHAQRSLPAGRPPG